MPRIKLLKLKQSNKLRYDKPVSAPASPSVSRASTPHHFSDDDDETESDEDTEVKSINSNGLSQTERNINQFLERAKSTENVFKNMNIKNEA